MAMHDRARVEGMNVEGRLGRWCGVERESAMGKRLHGFMGMKKV